MSFYYSPAFDYRPYQNGCQPCFFSRREELTYVERRCSSIAYWRSVYGTIEVSDEQYDQLCRRLARLHLHMGGGVPYGSFLRRTDNRRHDRQVRQFPYLNRLWPGDGGT